MLTDDMGKITKNYETNSGHILSAALTVVTSAKSRCVITRGTSFVADLKVARRRATKAAKAMVRVRQFLLT